MIVSETSYETSAPTVNSQLATAKASGANVLFGVVFGKFTSQLIKSVAELGWKPDLTFLPMSAASISFLAPAGLENAVGMISSSNQKDVNDVQWTNDANVKEFFAFMKQYMPTADLNNSNYSAGYHYGDRRMIHCVPKLAVKTADSFAVLVVEMESPTCNPGRGGRR